MAKHKIVWNNFKQALPGPKGEGHDCKDAGDTSPWMGEGRIMQEQLSRATQDAVAEDARRNLLKSGIRHEIAAVISFPRNDDKRQVIL